MKIIKEILECISIYLMLVGAIILLYINSIQQGVTVSIISICVLCSTLALVIKHSSVFRNKLSYYKTIVFHVVSMLSIVLIMFIFTPIVKKYNEHIPYRVLYHNTTKIIK